MGLSGTSRSGPIQARPDVRRNDGQESRLEPRLPGNRMWMINTFKSAIDAGLLAQERVLTRNSGGRERFALWLLAGRKVVPSVFAQMGSPEYADFPHFG